MNRRLRNLLAANVKAASARGADGVSTGPMRLPRRLTAHSARNA